MNANTFRTRGYTPADAAGLSLFVGWFVPTSAHRPGGPGGSSTPSGSRCRIASSPDQYVYPASHTANPGNTNPALQPAMGARFRLKSTVDLTSLTLQARIIAQAICDYGMLIVMVRTFTSRVRLMPWDEQSANADMERQRHPRFVARPQESAFQRFRGSRPRRSSPA